LGFGALLAKSRHVTDSMVEASSLGLANSLTPDEHASDLLYPRLDRIREIAGEVAVAVIRAAQQDGVDGKTELRRMNDAELLKLVLSKMWSPAPL
jgi:malate dehydrogenase (oxaloacetate-decarboxylating)(NADP+)